MHRYMAILAGGHLFTGLYCLSYVHSPLPTFGKGGPPAFGKRMHEGGGSMHKRVVDSNNMRNGLVDPVSFEFACRTVLQNVVNS